MRSEEKYALEALVEKYGGDFTEGENPPDGYVIIEAKKYAVEVTRLIQHVLDENGKLKSRVADDLPAYKMINEVDIELRNAIPAKKYVFVILRTPINNIRKTKIELTSKILEMINSGKVKEEIKICSNPISIAFYNGERESGKKVIAGLPNSRSSSDIGGNVDYLLLNRIQTKEARRKKLHDINGYWLALVNEYWIADEQSYQVSYENLGIQHGFDKIIFINDRKQCHELYSKI